MSELTPFTNTPASGSAGFLHRKWKLIRFFFEQRAFESTLEGILGAAAGHEGNSLPAGDPQYRLLYAEADALCKKFAHRWGLDIGLLKARISGLTKLERLSVPAQTLNYARIAYFSLVAIPVLSFLVGAVFGLVNVAFHFVGGR